MKRRTLIKTVLALLAISLWSGPALGEEAKPKPYPLDTCLVSGEKLGTMGKPVVINYEGQEIAFCCKGCKPKFEKNPAKYLEKLPKK